MMDRRILDRLHIQTWSTAGLYAYLLLAAVLGGFQPSIPTLEHLAENRGPPNLLSETLNDPELRPLLTIVPLLLIALIPLAAVYAFDFSQRMSPPSESTRWKLTRGALLSFAVAAVFLFIPFGLDPTATSHGISTGDFFVHMLSASVFTATFLIALFFWGAQLFTVVGFLCLWRAVRAP